MKTYRTGDEVILAITGMVPTYKGIVKNPTGYCGAPEIEVTQRYYVKGGWLEEKTWPLLRHGDYVILEEEQYA
jgi:hypothetical protein